VVRGNARYTDANVTLNTAFNAAEFNQLLAMDVAFTRVPHTLTIRPTQECAHVRQPPHRNVPPIPPSYWRAGYAGPSFLLDHSRKHYYPRFSAGVDVCANAHV
jgi:hypothetical protein